MFCCCTSSEKDTDAINVNPVVGDENVPPTVFQPEGASAKLPPKPEEAQIPKRALTKEESQEEKVRTLCAWQKILL